MTTVGDFLENTRANNIIVQKALREIDTELLVCAMAGMDEGDRGIILRNMSKRAAGLVGKDLEEREDNISRHTVEEALQFFVRLLLKHKKYTKDETVDTETPESPAIDVRDEAGIVTTFVGIVSYARRHGILSLEGLDEKTDHPILKKGLELIVDGWDPLVMQGILDRSKKAYLADVEKKLDMIIEGIDSLATGDHPIGTRERLTAFLQKS